MPSAKCNVIGAGGIGVALAGALARTGWNVTMVDINEAKLETGCRDGIEINGVKESNLRFTSFAEWTPADRAILLLCRMVSAAGLAQLIWRGPSIRISLPQSHDRRELMR